MPPYFTVVIPTYNRAGLIKMTLDSILRQTVENFEIVVVDNGSTDNTAEVIRTYEPNPRIKYIRFETNYERGYSRNVGFRNATGNYVTLLDSDDIMYPDCLKDALEFVTLNPSVKVFHNLYEMIDENNEPIKSLAFAPIINQYKQICQSNFLSCVGVFLEKEVYQRYFFTEDLRMIGSEDYEIWFRVLAVYSVGRINKVNCGVRQHAGRSVYSNIYGNLEYQRIKLLSLIQGDATMTGKYGPYIGYINANFYYHEAMYALHIGKKWQAVQKLAKGLTKGKGLLLSRRFLGVVKNFMFRST